MHRFYAAPASSTSPDTEYLTPEDSRHALTVLRLSPGAQVEIVCDGIPWLSEIVSAEGSRGCVRKLAPLPSTEPRLSVTLFQGLPKADKMDWIVQKATELGVSAVVPVAMARSVVRLSEADGLRKTERWRKISREAGKQSGRCIIPEISLPVTLPQLLARTDLPALNAVPWEEAGTFGPLALRALHPEITSLGILIGPEGGITAEEITLLKTGGFLPMTLGKRILRTETAGLAAVAALMCLYGEME